MSAAPRAIVTDDPPFLIRPSHIGIDVFLLEAFGHRRTALAARTIVRYCQHVDERAGKTEGWTPFFHSELTRFHEAAFPDVPWPGYQRLLIPERVVSSLDGESFHGGGWVYVASDNRLYLTEDFIRECYSASPAWPVNLPYRRVVEDEPDFPIQPADIDLSKSLHWAFPDLIDGPEAHGIAKDVIRFCQDARGWSRIAALRSLDPLADPAYVWKKGEKVPITAGFLVRGEDGLYRVTDDFIFRCYGRAGRSAAR